jgi:hypothetical protein
MTSKRKKIADNDGNLTIFDALLDHLGRLLAEEYVALLSSELSRTKVTEEDEP